MKQAPPVGTIHDKLPKDLEVVLLRNKAVLATWNDITPLARNEWICWVENAKLNETRTRRIKRAEEELSEGTRRPCCWMGCIHRTDKDVSPSVQWVLSKDKARRGK
ncbi:YdeI/OmpD-associated family protein [Candidatus Saccharibacteria bacterium TM7i]|nr:YdeI/OmpD-associated family protein [Candidatus Saccharibacteria bacterium TM7i]